MISRSSWAFVSRSSWGAEGPAGCSAEVAVGFITTQNVMPPTSTARRRRMLSPKPKRRIMFVGLGDCSGSCDAWVSKSGICFPLFLPALVWTYYPVVLGVTSAYAPECVEG